jgi:hypothetical protein
LLVLTTACGPSQSNAAGGKPGSLGGSNSQGTGGQGTGGQGTPTPSGTPAPSGAPSLAGQTIVLASNAEFSGDDAVTDASGTAYIGWIGDSGSGRQVSLCVLPQGATSCQGGVSTIDSLSSDGADGLHVLLTGPHTVTLVWEYLTAASETGPEGDGIAVATSSGGPLSAARRVSAAPSFGLMLDAAVAPDGSVWVLTRVDGKNAIQVRPGFTSAPVTLSTPWLTAFGLLRFDGSTPVLVIDKDGSIGGPISVTSRQGGTWSAFRTVPKTWTTANFGLASTPSGVRLIATVDNSSYQPVVAAWNGTGFGTPVLTGDTNACAPSSHDPVSDASGRLADVSMECGDVAVANLPDTVHAAVFRFPVNGTFAGTLPQLTTAPNGQAWVTWSIESKHGDTLMAAPLLLPGQ